MSPQTAPPIIAQTTITYRRAFKKTKLEAKSGARAREP